MNRSQLDRLVVPGGIRPVRGARLRSTRVRRAPMVYSRKRFVVMFLMTLAVLLAAIALGQLGVI